MIPEKTIEELITRHSSLEKDLASGNVDKKSFAEKSKEYSDLNEIVYSAKKYASYKNEKIELVKKNLEERKIQNLDIKKFIFSDLEFLFSITSSLIALRLSRSVKSLKYPPY